jgi:acetyl esterase/lipase
MPIARFRLAWGGLAFLMTVGQALPVETTYTYKTVGNLEIKANVARTPLSGLNPHPVLIWIHGGALIFGNREGWPKMAPELEAAGISVVSIDYRLAPETKLPDVIRDVVDAYVWVCRKGPQLFGADPNRIAVAGGSAGGYLALVLGYRVEPRPNAVVSFWGYGDLIGPWYSEPSPYPRHHTVTTTLEAAFKEVSGPPIADDRDRKGNGQTFYLFCRQQGLWPWAVTGWDPHREALKFYPYMPLKNVTPDYPPTLLVHGDQDTDVPYEQSVLMAKELEKNGVEHTLIGVPGAEHGLEHADPDMIATVNRRAVTFLREHLGQ